MPISPRTPAQHHYVEAERALADLGKLGADEAERIVEVLVALVHATLSVSAQLASKRTGRHPSAPDFGRDY